MSEIIAIEGGHKLNGTVEISGAKNATVALIPAIILADSPVTIYGVPEISDVDALAVLLEELNCTVLRSHDSLIVDPSRMENVPLVSDAVDKLRASYYLMGALLGKCKKVCPMEVEVNNNARNRKNATECILCMRCVEECPVKALKL